MNGELMKELLENKDKIKASNVKRDSFMKEWLSYVKENGYDESAEGFLYNGFEYRKMLPFAEYAKETGTYCDAVNAFLKSKSLTKNNQKTYKMLLALLAATISIANTEGDAIATIIRRIPNYSKNKEGDAYPDLNKIFEKFFIAELSKDASLPDFVKLNLTPAMKKTFCTLVKDSITGLNPKKDDDRAKLNAIQNWIGVPACEPEQIHPNSDSTKVLAPSEPIDENPPAVTFEQDSSNNVIAEPAKPAKPETQEENWKTGIAFLEKMFMKFEGKVSSLKDTASQYSHEISSLNSQIGKLKDANASKDMQIANYKNEISSLSKEIDSLNQKIQEQASVISERETEIADRIKLTDIVSKDSARQSDAVLRRIAGELSSFHEDFVNAKSVEMNTEIGEILRDQTEEIYKILEKYGITF